MRITAVVHHRGGPGPLLETVEDLGRQTRLPDELLIIADPLPGGVAVPPLDTLRGGVFAEATLPITVHVASSLGSTSPMTIARALSYGDAVLFLDAGDRLAPEATAVLEDGLTRYPDCAVAYARHLFGAEQRVVGAPLDRDALVASNYIRGAVLMRREVLTFEALPDVGSAATWDTLVHVLVRDARPAYFDPRVLSSSRAPLPEHPDDARPLAGGRRAALRWQSFARAPAGGPRRPRILAYADVRGWAFDRNLRDMMLYLPEFEWSLWYLSERERWPPLPPVDLFYVPYQKWPIYLDPSRSAGSLRSRSISPERGHGQPPSAEDIALVNAYRRYHVVSQAALSDLAPHCPRLEYLTNPVCMRRAGDPTRIRGTCVASWNGNARHAKGQINDVKGFESIVIPACRSAGVALRSAEYNTTRLAPDAMPDFYRNANVALCASLYEGTSNSVMEAMAAGLALISTDCGNVRELAASQREHFGDSGILIVERNVTAFAAALAELKTRPDRIAEMGALNRAEIAARWSWEAWRDRYEAFFRRALACAAS